MESVRVRALAFAASVGLLGAVAAGVPGAPAPLATTLAPGEAVAVECPTEHARHGATGCGSPALPIATTASRAQSAAATPAMLGSSQPSQSASGRASSSSGLSGLSGLSAGRQSGPGAPGAGTPSPSSQPGHGNATPSAQEGLFHPGATPERGGSASTLLLTGPPSAPSLGIDACPHNATTWHGLVERGGDGSITCSYGHEHKDDPGRLDGLFGSVPYGEVGHPWHAMGHHGPEQHNTFNWSVIKDAPCSPPGNLEQSFTNLRVQIHAAGAAAATRRYHSYFIQGEACDKNDPSWRGRITTGGWLDFGVLQIHSEGVNVVKVPLPGDPPPSMLPNGQREHGGLSSSRRHFIWYGTNGASEVSNGPLISVNVGLTKEAWGPVDPADPDKLLFYGGDRNGSIWEPAHLINVVISRNWNAQHGVSGDSINFRGWTDRYGQPATNCTSAGADCVPLILENMKSGMYQFRNDRHGIGVREYDVKVDGQSLIQFPN